MSSLSQAQRRALCALIDTFLPALGADEIARCLGGARAPKVANPAAAAEMLRTGGGEMGVVDAMEELLGKGAQQKRSAKQA